MASERQIPLIASNKFTNARHLSIKTGHPIIGQKFRVAGELRVKNMQCGKKSLRSSTLARNLINLNTYNINKIIYYCDVLISISNVLFQHVGLMRPLDQNLELAKFLLIFCLAKNWKYLNGIA